MKTPKELNGVAICLHSITNILSTYFEILSPGMMFLDFTSVQISIVGGLHLKWLLTHSLPQIVISNLINSYPQSEQGKIGYCFNLIFEPQSHEVHEGTQSITVNPVFLLSL